MAPFIRNAEIRELGGSGLAPLRQANGTALGPIWRRVAGRATDVGPCSRREATRAIRRRPALSAGDILF
jgi:hypothetical protein